MHPQLSRAPIGGQGGQRPPKPWALRKGTRAGLPLRGSLRKGEGGWRLSTWAGKAGPARMWPPFLLPSQWGKQGREVVLCPMTQVEGDRDGLEPRPSLGRHRDLWLLQLEPDCPAPSRRPRRRGHSTEPPGWAPSPSSTRQGVSIPEGSTGEHPIDRPRLVHTAPSLPPPCRICAAPRGQGVG